MISLRNPCRKKTPWKALKISRISPNNVLDFIIHIHQGRHWVAHLALPIAKIYPIGSMHVWNIYLHLPEMYAKCRQLFHTWSIWVWVFEESLFAKIGDLMIDSTWWCGESNFTTFKIATGAIERKGSERFGSERGYRSKIPSERELRRYPHGWMSQEVNGSKVIGSVGYFTPIYPQYTPLLSRWNNPLILTIDPNFLGHPSRSLFKYILGSQRLYLLMTRIDSAMGFRKE